MNQVVLITYLLLVSCVALKSLDLTFVVHREQSTKFVNFRYLQNAVRTLKGHQEILRK